VPVATAAVVDVPDFSSVASIAVNALSNHACVTS